MSRSVYTPRTVDPKGRRSTCSNTFWHRWTWRTWKNWTARVTFVSVSGTGPGAVAHNPVEFRAKLDAFVQQQSEAHGIDAEALALFSNDVTTDVDDALLKAVKETGADLVIMASHKPGLAEYFWPSNGGKIASHSEASVFVVRDP